ncbi:hypothetical protein [Orrella marina]|uniref:Uncharacterized protein n=1 Tax=Orrella marina TaxID=2163011 RepID=A0A2R4XLA1_9BURK|nr:hypothetical protein [Orrella marina]AWB34541.1 hypothetical protein DBV39_13400 [Orrella marina]
MECICGHLILDNHDHLSNKGHVIPDQLWLDLLDRINSAIERPGKTDKERETACMAVRKKLNDSKRTAWQCDTCERLYIDDTNGRTLAFESASTGVATGIFRGF